MRIFNLIRLEDASGVSGSGVVAEGIQWTDGEVHVNWLTATSSKNHYRSIEDVIKIHGHGDRTVVVWREFPPK
jgi:hypothetical protein